MVQIILIALLLLGTILLLRGIGAWMLRINEVISRLDKILAELKEANKTD